MGEIDVFIEGLAPAEGGDQESADSIPDSPANIQVSQPGDLWLLDKHRVLSADALSAEAYEWVYDKVRSDIWLAPISGGTDFAGAFVAGCPLLPVYSGEMQCRCLGAKVEAYDEAGNPLIEAVGELVCSAPMPFPIWPVAALSCTCACSAVTG